MQAAYPPTPDHTHARTAGTSPGELCSRRCSPLNRGICLESRISADPCSIVNPGACSVSVVKRLRSCARGSAAHLLRSQRCQIHSFYNCDPSVARYVHFTTAIPALPDTFILQLRSQRCQIRSSHSCDPSVARYVHFTVAVPALPETSSSGHGSILVARDDSKAEFGKLLWERKRLTDDIIGVYFDALNA